MREKVQEQMPLIESVGSHSQEKELEIISRIINRMPTSCERVLQYLKEINGTFMFLCVIWFKEKML